MDDVDLEIKTKKSKNQNTEKTENRADKAFTNFLIAMGCSPDETDYWNFTEPELDTYLAKFWFGARKDGNDEETTDAESDPQLKSRMYKANTLKNFRYGLNWILKSKGHLYDITDKKTASFVKSQQAFNDAIKELKIEGKGEVTNYPEITEEGKTWFYISMPCSE